jgi:hypothetical protein
MELFNRTEAQTRTKSERRLCATVPEANFMAGSKLLAAETRVGSQKGSATTTSRSGTDAAFRSRPSATL